MEQPNNSRYFDYAASSPPWPEAIDAYTRNVRLYYANPSSQHTPGKAAKQRLLALKKEFCDMIRYFDGRLLLCASGTEANNTIIDGHMNMFPKGKLLIAEDVHESIWYAVEKYKKAVETIKIDHSGQLSVDQLEKALNNKPTLVCISHVCNETGVIHPVKEIADLCFSKQTRILIDGAQSVGHVPLHFDDVPFTYYSFSGHKFGSVKSTGGVLVRDDQFLPMLKGGKQEWGLRAGTEDVAGLAAMVAALKMSIEHWDVEKDQLKMLKQLVIDKLIKIPGLVVNSPKSSSLPGLLSLSVPGYSGREIVGALALSGYAISTGSACHENELAPSRIMLAMGRTEEEAIGSIRISMGPGTTGEAVDGLVKALLELIK